MFRSRKVRAQLGLSLIELLLVLAIVGTLMAIAVPILLSHVERSRKVLAINDVKDVSVKIDIYFTDHGEYPDSLSDVGQAGREDPWGAPYQYLRILGGQKNVMGKARKDHNLHPINSTYDLYSMGPDGASTQPLTAAASRDDILRANDGAFVGLAEEY